MTQAAHGNGLSWGKISRVVFAIIYSVWSAKRRVLLCCDFVNSLPLTSSSSGFKHIVTNTLDVCRAVQVKGSLLETVLNAVSGCWKSASVGILRGGEKPSICDRSRDATGLNPAFCYEGHPSMLRNLLSLRSCRLLNSERAAAY